MPRALKPHSEKQSPSSQPREAFAKPERAGALTDPPFPVEGNPDLWVGRVGKLGVGDPAGAGWWCPSHLSVKALPAGSKSREDFPSAPRLWARRKPEFGGSGAAPRPAAASAHVLLDAGTPLPQLRPVRARIRDPLFGAARPGCSRSALPKIPYINCGQSPKKHSSLLAVAGLSCRAVRAAEGK